MNLETKSKRVSLVISLKGMEQCDILEMDRNLYEVLTEGDYTRFAFILHDRDTLDSGEVKTPHFHIYIESGSTARLGTYLNRMAKELKVNPLAISIQKVSEPESVIQYLIHKNAPDKFQYPRDEIRTNLDKDTLDLILDTESIAWNVDYLVHVIKECEGCVYLIIKTIGLERYRQYRKVIMDLMGNYKA